MCKYCEFAIPNPAGVYLSQEDIGVQNGIGVTVIKNWVEHSELKEGIVLCVEAEIDTSEDAYIEIDAVFNINYCPI